MVLIYRHSEEMIKKLESAGLGFYVRATKTQQKLGECIYIVVFHSWEFDQSSHCREHPSTTAGLPCTGPTTKHATTGLWLWSAKPWNRKGLHKADCAWSCEDPFVTVMSSSAIMFGHGSVMFCWGSVMSSCSSVMSCWGSVMLCHCSVMFVVVLSSMFSGLASGLSNYIQVSFLSLMLIWCS